MRREMTDFMRLVRDEDRREAAALDVDPAGVWVGRIADELRTTPLRLV